MCSHSRRGCRRRVCLGGCCWVVDAPNYPVELLLLALHQSISSNHDLSSGHSLYVNYYGWFNKSRGGVSGVVAISDSIAWLSSLMLNSVFDSVVVVFIAASTFSLKMSAACRRSVSMLLFVFAGSSNADAFRIVLIVGSANMSVVVVVDMFVVVVFVVVGAANMSFVAAVNDSSNAACLRGPAL